MSEKIHMDLQEEIINRVFDVKSLIRFRLVSKQWKSFIDSSKFIIHQSVNQTQPRHRFLLSYQIPHGYKYVSIVDDDNDSFMNNKFYPIVPTTLKEVSQPFILGCSHGLVSSYIKYKNLIVVWNPSISKSVNITVSSELRALGFGVCPITYDPKIVKLTVDCKAEVFTLSTGAWRSIVVDPGLHLESVDIYFLFSTPLVMDVVIYWSAFDRNAFLLISFDLISEEFGKIDIPDSLQGHEDLLLYKRKESLALVGYSPPDSEVWFMKKNGDLNPSFEKLFELSNNGKTTYKITGFGMNGLPMIVESHNFYYDYRVDDDDDDDDDDDYNDYEYIGVLKVYDPSSQHMSKIEMDADALYDGFTMTSYTESLLMLNQPATIF